MMQLNILYTAEGLSIEKRTTSTIYGILLGYWQRRHVVIGARSVSSFGVAHRRMDREHVFKCATVTDSGGRAAAQWTSSNTDTVQ
uniref:Uncharacterized protein n=1 Tax=Ascaris lumbricoides TaxID=6252 RepID=A0A0M3IGA2_ASCLU